MGANKDYSDEQAVKSVPEVLEFLNIKYKVGRSPNGPFSRNLQKDYDEAVKKLEESLKEIFWIDACDTF